MLTPVGLSLPIHVVLQFKLPCISVFCLWMNKQTIDCLATTTIVPSTAPASTSSTSAGGATASSVGITETGDGKT